jgi:hypothetical protein
MAKSPKKPKAREDLNQLAARIVAEATGAKPKTLPATKKAGATKKAAPVRKKPA